MPLSCASVASRSASTCARACPRAAGLSSISARGWSRPLPMRHTCSTQWLLANSPSMGAGATYLPLLVLKMSFTRPVMRR
ncbi:hypothetical protein D3C80_1779640 [compost metagenome]